MKYIITGGCGFLGSNLAFEILKNKDELVVFDNLSRFGSAQNLEWMKTLGTFDFVSGDIRNTNDVENLIRNHQPDVIFHLAGQVAMTTSIVDPRKDFEINTLGTFNVLDSVRKYAKEAIVVYSSTNKVYGDLETLRYEEQKKKYVLTDFPQGLPESIQLQFSSPYGCSKGSADQYMLDFHKMYGLKTVVLRHSSMYGGRQFATYDQGWVGWFCEQAVKTKQDKNHTFTISGNGKQVRDLLYVTDMIDLYFAVTKSIDVVQGNAFNIGGSSSFALSLLELFDILELKLDVKLNYTKLSARESDQKVFIADVTKINTLIGWKPKVNPDVGLSKMLEWVTKK